MRKKRNRKRNDGRKQLKVQDEDGESMEATRDGVQYQIADDSILRVDINAGFASSQSSSESDFSDPESSYRNKLRCDCR